MSTIVVVKKNGYATIGADTLTMYGSTKESSEYILDHSKIIKSKNNYFAIVGHASWGLVLNSYFSNLKKDIQLDSSQKIFEFSRSFHKKLKDDYFINTEEDEDDPFESSQLDCLIANNYGIYGLYSLRSVQEYTKFYAFGAGYKFALGAMRTVYDMDMSSEEIARIGLETASDFDDSTGLPIELHTIKLK